MGIIKLHKTAGGKDFLELKPDVVASQIEYATKNNIKHFILSWHRHESEGINNLSFLESNQVKGLLLNFEFLDDHSELNRFTEIDIFLASYLSKPNSDIDFGNFPNLKILDIYWNKNFKQIEKLKDLIRLNIWHYKPKSRTLIDFINLNKLVYMTIVMASIDNLNGIENLLELQELRLANNRTVKAFFTEPERSKLQLNELCIETCKNLDLETLPRIETLRRLRLIDVGKVETLKNILPKFPNLESLVFTQSELIDGDINYLLDFPSIKRITIDNKKHYSLKEKDIQILLDKRNDVSLSQP